MNAYVFMHVLYFTLIKTLAEKEADSKCESKVELRAVLLSCPPKDSGCDDDDPLSQAMAAEEAQIFQGNPKKIQLIKEEKEKGFPNAVKDCKRKLIITLKMRNSGKIPCDDEYIIVDHVFDPVTGGRGRLLSPLVLKIRQEQMMQLYGLQFQRVVNSDPFEEQKETDKTCSVNSDNPTCGIAMYDGKPIPFSEGFCCSCDPELNSKRLLSAAFHGDSFLYRDSKLISRRNDRFSRDGSPSAAIVNPDLVRLKKDGNASKDSGKENSDDDKESSCPIKGLAPDKVPNYLMEHDHKIVCGKGNFLSELCKLRDEKCREEEEAAGAAVSRGDVSGRKGIRSGESNNFIARVNTKFTSQEEPVRMNGVINGLANTKTEIAASPTTAAAAAAPANLDFREGHGNEKLVAVASGDSNDAMILKTLMGAAANSDQTTEVDYRSAKTNRIIRGKRENFHWPTPSKTKMGTKKFTLDEKLDEFANSKNLLTKRRKRLLELSHNRFRKGWTTRKEIRCRDAEECKTVMATDYPRDDNARNSPPKFFFSHDKYIIQPGGSSQGILNSTCRSSDDVDYEDAAGVDQQKCAGSSKNDDATADDDGPGKEAKKFRDSKFGKSNPLLQSYEMRKNQEREKFRETNPTVRISDKKERLRGKFESSIFKGGTRLKSGEYQEKKNGLAANGKKLKASGVSGRKEESQENEDEVNAKGVRDEEEAREKKNQMEKLGNVEEEEEEEEEGRAEKSQKFNRFNAKNIKNFLLRNDEEKNLSKQKITNFLLSKNRERQKLLSQIIKNHNKPEVGGGQSLKRDRFEKYLAQEMEESKEDELPPEEKKMDQIKLVKEGKEERERKDRLNPTVDENELESREGNSAGSKGEESRDESRKNLIQNLKLKEKLEKMESSPPKGKLAEERRKSFRRPSGMRVEAKYGLARPHFHQEAGNVDFNFEIIRKPAQELASSPRSHSAKMKEYLKARMEAPASNADFNRRAGSLLRIRQQHPALLYKTTPQKFFVAKENKADASGAQDVYFRPLADPRNRVRSKASESPGREPESLAAAGNDKLPQKYETHRFQEKYFVPVVDFDAYKKEVAKAQRARQNLLKLNPAEKGGSPAGLEGESPRAGPDDFASEGTFRRVRTDDVDDDVDGARIKRSVGPTFEPAEGFLGAEAKDPGAAHPLGGCGPEGRARRQEGRSRAADDGERLLRSYGNAPDYVRERARAGPKGKREASETGEDSPKGRSNCEKKPKEGGDKSGDTARCMRFGDLWYSVYEIKRPVIAQIVGLQLFDKHGSCEGSTQWRDLTKGKMVRIGTFLSKAEDELPTISMTFIGGKTKKAPTAIDPDNYLLLVPSHVSDPSKAGYYPQFDGGPEEYLVVDSKDVSSGGDCDMVGTSFEAFARQPDRCSRPRGSCLKRQPVDLWREDMEARIRGKRGKYFVENFGTVSNSPIKTYTNFTGEFLALEYYGEYTSTLEIEVKADFNALVRKGSNAQIPTVYIDGTYPKKTRIILSVLNIGLTSSYFRPRLGDCPPDLDPAWCPLEGPLVTISPQQRHDFKLDLSGALPPNKIHVTVEVLNQLNKKVAYRKIIIKKGDRCICAFHCKCNCVGNVDGRTCHKLKVEEYRGAGYVGPFPFRGGSASSASESIRKNIRVIFSTAANILFLMGVIKGILGIFCRRLGIAGTRVIVGPRQLSQYYESELKSCTVLFDDCGFPIHPTTCLPVQIVPLWIEILINFIFFFIYPLRGIWYLIISLPCCTLIVEMCDESSQQDEGGSDNEQKSSDPLLSKPPQPTCVSYTLTSLNTKKAKAEEYLPYLPYKGDDDPLEEDDTEFVLQEMKRYRKKK